MTGTEFRKGHGDPAKWSDLEYEQYGQVATRGGDPVPTEVLAFLKQPPQKAIVSAGQPVDPGLEQHLPTPRSTQPAA